MCADIGAMSVNTGTKSNYSRTSFVVPEIAVVNIILPAETLVRKIS